MNKLVKKISSMGKNSSLKYMLKISIENEKEEIDQLNLIKIYNKSHC